MDIKKRNTVDISMLDDQVLDALCIDKKEADNVNNQDINATFLE